MEPRCWVESALVTSGGVFSCPIKVMDRCRSRGRRGIVADNTVMESSSLPFNVTVGSSSIEADTVAGLRCFSFGGGGVPFIEDEPDAPVPPSSTNSSAHSHHKAYCCSSLSNDGFALSPRANVDEFSRIDEDEPAEWTRFPSISDKIAVRTDCNFWISSIVGFVSERDDGLGQSHHPLW